MANLKKFFLERNLFGFSQLTVCFCKITVFKWNIWKIDKQFIGITMWLLKTCKNFNSNCVCVQHTFVKISIKLVCSGCSISIIESARLAFLLWLEKEIFCRRNSIRNLLEQELCILNLQAMVKQHDYRQMYVQLPIDLI